ncbi:MAG: hypothetical protein WD872_16105 [Pirellulaceae bacterium]
MRAWVFQDTKQLAKLGESKCPWSAGWYDPDGKRKSKSIGSKSNATKHARKMEGQIASGNYQGTERKAWGEFRKEFVAKIAATKAAGTRQVIEQSLDAFEAAVNPVRVASIKTGTVDSFIAKRQASRGRRPGSVKSAASINKELRTLKAVFRVAHDWGYLAAVPKMRMLKEPGKLPRYITAAEFALLYDACDTATLPAEGMPYSACDWWRGLLTFAYMTGWRVGECLAVKRTDVDMDAATAITRAVDNKGKRDEAVPLHPVIIDHLKRLPGFSPMMLP